MLILKLLSLILPKLYSTQSSYLTCTYCIFTSLKLYIHLVFFMLIKHISDCCEMCDKHCQLSLLLSLQFSSNNSWGCWVKWVFKIVSQPPLFPEAFVCLFVCLGLESEIETARQLHEQNLKQKHRNSFGYNLYY